MSITKPFRSILQVRRQSFEKGSFISNVCNNKYVLVIGSEVILDKEKHAADNGDIQQYILSRLNEALGRDENPYPNLNALVAARPAVSTDEEASGADLIRNLLIPSTDSEEDDTGDEGSYITVNDLSPELISLLDTRLFRFVMTTSIDNNVEFIMRSIWKEQLRVVNFADQDDWKKFQKEIEETLDRTDYTHTTYKYTTPTLIYVFGKVTNDHSKNFMKTENDAIEFIDRWMNRHDPFTVLIKEKRMLALGCKFDDWYFRFFWFILKRDFNKLGDGEVAFSLDSEKPEDQKLKHYLERKHVFIHDDARKFMQSISNMLNPDNNNPDSRAFHEIIKSKRGEGEIFLSYCSQDFILASQIFFRLTNLGYSVWFDNEKLCGGNYEVDIRQAIHKAKVVITLLTPTIQKDLENGVLTRFYQKEWRMASEIGNERIIPLAADGYSLRGSYHSRQEGDTTILETYEEIIGRPISGIDLMTDGFDKLVNVINNKK